jgi:hypothetical protein
LAYGLLSYLSGYSVLVVVLASGLLLWANAEVLTGGGFTPLVLLLL